MYRILIMNLLAHKIAFILLLLLVSINLLAQDENGNQVIETQLEFNDISENLLSLQDLLGAAEVHSPLLKMIDADIIIQELKVKSEKKDWLTYFSIDGSAKYGVFDNLILKEDLGVEDVSTHSTKQARYSVGVMLRLPISRFFDNSEKQIAENEAVKLNYQRERTVQELRNLVIVQYGNVLKAGAKLSLSTSEFESVKMQMMNTELNYKRGQISIADYTTHQSRYLDAKLVLEEAKIEFSTALFLLQETVGVNINLNKQN